MVEESIRYLEGMCRKIEEDGRDRSWGTVGVAKSFLYRNLIGIGTANGEGRSRLISD